MISPHFTHFTINSKNKFLLNYFPIPFSACHCFLTSDREKRFSIYFLRILTEIAFSASILKELFIGLCPLKK